MKKKKLKFLLFTNGEVYVWARDGLGYLVWKYDGRFVDGKYEQLWDKFIG
jgi:hypothetical protein